MCSPLRSLLFLALNWSALSACHKCPPPVIPAPVVEVAKPPECDLPDLPGPIHPAIGYPDPNGIYLTRTDFADLASYVMALRDWVLAAQPCLTRKP
jgi:hypothetical protein